jgi:NADH-quinone oxidoreductase subunit G
MDEDYYALSKLARTAFRTNDLDHRRDHGAGSVEGAIAGAGMPVTYRNIEEAEVILVAGLDAEQEVPILHLRLRKAAVRGARILVLHPRRTRLWDVAEHILCRPGDEAWLLEKDEGRHRPEIAAVAAALREAGDAGLVLAGPRLADHPQAVDRARTLASDTGVRFAYVTRRAIDRGALVAGVHPWLLLGGRTVGDDEDRAEVEAVWGSLGLAEGGRSWREILEACANREIDVLFLIGVDPLRDYPDAELARRALGNVPRKVVQSLELGSLARFADAFLPAAAFLEKEGHVTTWEGRGQRIRRVRDPLGISRPDWEIFASLALACGGDLGFETLEELHEEMGSLLAPRATRPLAVADTGAGQAPVEDGQLLLFTYPLLVDEGRLSEGAVELKAALADPPFVEVHPEDAGRAGVADGADVLLSTAAGEATLPARVTEHVAEGAVFVPFNQAGFAANTLLQGRFSIPATIQAVDAPTDADAVAEIGVGGAA